MRRDQLEHALRAACEVSGDTELLVFGSQAILGSYPSAPESLRSSIEAAVLPAGWDERTVAASKLAAGREKDRLFVATLLHEGLVDGEILLERVVGLPVADERRDAISRWVETTVASTS